MRLSSSFLIASLLALAGCPASTTPAGTTPRGTRSSASPPANADVGGEPDDADPGDAENRDPYRSDVPIGSGATTPPAAPASDGLAGALAGIVDAHNRVRAAHCVPPLAWSPSLAATAQRWADHLRDTGCNLEHSRTPYGENLAWYSPAGSGSAADVVDGWYREISAYDFRNPVFGMDTGHFTQVIWRGTTQVGCARSVCRDAELWVCNYDPAGNVDGEFPDNVPKRCR